MRLLRSQKTTYPEGNRARSIGVSAGDGTAETPSGRPHRVASDPDLTLNRHTRPSHKETEPMRTSHQLPSCTPRDPATQRGHTGPASLAPLFCTLFILGIALVPRDARAGISSPLNRSAQTSSQLDQAHSISRE